MDQLIAELRQFTRERDWEKFHKPKDLAVSVTIEAAELVEIFQWVEETSEVSDEMKERIADEAADVLLYLALLCDKVGLDLIELGIAKLEKNRVRFPAT